MPLTSTEKSLCNKLVSDYAGLIAPVKGAKSGIIAQKNDLKNYLQNIRYSPPGDLANAFSQFTSRVGTFIPNPNDLNSISNFLKNCDYLNNLGPAKTIVGLTQSVFSSMSSLINDMKVSVPEFGAADLASKLNSILGNLLPGGQGITDILNQVDKLLNCLDAICSVQDPYYYDDLNYITNDVNSLYTDMGLISGGPNNGKFDYDALYTSLGMDINQITAINSTINLVDQQKERAQNAIKNTLTVFKSSLF